MASPRAGWQGAEPRGFSACELSVRSEEGGLGDPPPRAPLLFSEAAGCARSSSVVSILSSWQQLQGRRETSFNSGLLPLPSEACLGDLTECHLGIGIEDAPRPRSGSSEGTVHSHKLLDEVSVTQEAGAPWGHGRSWVAQWAEGPGGWLCPEASGDRCLLSPRALDRAPVLEGALRWPSGGRGSLPCSCRQWPISIPQMRHPGCSREV